MNWKLVVGYLGLLGLLAFAGGCCLFEKSRVEARANYDVMTNECGVSLVAVGYCGD